MATVNTSIRLDRELKERADEFFEEVGMSFSTAINIFLRQTLRLGKIPFTIAVDRPNEETIAALLEGERLLYDPTAKSYTDLDELFADLEKDDE